jgi:uncharacterized protein YciI
MISYGDRGLRDQVRPDHREYLKSQLEAGTLVSSGPFTDDSGALLIYEAESEAALQAILDQDPFWTTDGVLESVSIKEWKVLFQRNGA